MPRRPKEAEPVPITGTPLDELLAVGSELFGFEDGGPKRPRSGCRCVFEDCWIIRDPLRKPSKKARYMLIQQCTRCGGHRLHKPVERDTKPQDWLDNRGKLATMKL